MKSALSQQQGFTLIEVMVALVLSSVALLGLAAGELKSLQYATNSFNYTVSLIQANNAIEQTWVNLCNLQNGTTTYDDAYATSFLNPQIDTYRLTATPGASSLGIFNELDITVNWTDARMADTNNSVIRLIATYPQICP